MSAAPYNPFTLAGKRVLVTGASSGIGRCIAVEFSRLGASIVLTARREEELAATLASLAGEGHVMVPADITDGAQRERIVEQSGALDAVVHCAGTSLLSPLRLANEKHFRDLYSLNYEAPMLLTQRLLYRKSVQNGGSILFLASIAAHIGVPGVGAYSGTKAALLATLRCLALEVVKQKIRVNALSPALVQTALLEKTGQHVSLEEKERDYPLGFGRPEDVAWAAAYFISDASRWVTGTTLVMDGGLTIS